MALPWVRVNSCATTSKAVLPRNIRSVPLPHPVDLLRLCSLPPTSDGDELSGVVKARHPIGDADPIGPASLRGILRFCRLANAGGDPVAGRFCSLDQFTGSFNRPLPKAIRSAPQV